MTIEYWIIAALAVYRLSLLISKETGPFDIFGRFRTWAGVTYDNYSNPVPSNHFAEGLLCPFCVSVWLGIIVTIYMGLAVYFNVAHIAIYPLMPLALSGVAVYLFRIAGV